MRRFVSMQLMQRTSESKRVVDDLVSGGLKLG